MASNFAAVNPKYLGNGDGRTPGMALVKIRAADSKTWKRGEIGTLSSGTVQPISGATGGTAPYCQFAEDQNTSTSTSDVWVYIIPDGAEFEIYVTSNGSDAAIGQANVGTKYALYTASNVTYLDVSVTSGADCEVLRCAADYEPEQNAAADTPGKCIIKVRL